MDYRVAVYNNVTGVAQRLSLLCAGEVFEIFEAKNRKELEKLLQEERIHMILLDIMVEDQGWGKGIELISDLRRTSRLPILVVSGQKSENARITALNVGADDYILADDNPLVLLARIRSQLRRFVQMTGVQKNIERIYQVDDLRIEADTRRVTVEGREVKLTPIEYSILLYLVKGKGSVHSVKEIYEEIWKMRAVGADNTIAVHIRHLREKIEDNPREPKYIKVVWGTGYRVG